MNHYPFRPTIFACSLVAASFFSQPAAAGITLDNIGSISGQIDRDGVTLDTLTLTTTENTAVFLFFSTDAAATITATFAGESMTVLQDPTASRAVIAYLADPANLSGDLVLNTSSTGGGAELAYWGVASGIDTSLIKTTTGSSVSIDTQSNTAFPALGTGDVVYSMFAINAYSNGFPYGSGLAAMDGAFTHHEAIVTTDTVEADGAFAPTVGFTPGDGRENSPAGVSISFTPIVTAYSTCSGGSPFGDDENGDGIPNGISFLLGAADPTANARPLLPVGREENGDLILTFDCLKGANRGSAVLSVQHVADLQGSWASVEVPGVVGSSLSSAVVFEVTDPDPLDGLLRVEAKIDMGEAGDGSLFGRLAATE